MADANSGAPTPEDCLAWAEDRGLEHPVAADDGSVLPYVISGFPTYVVIDREMVIQDSDMWPWSDSFVTSLF